MTVSDPTTRATYQEGVAAGAIDNMRVQHCPPARPIGGNRPRGYPNNSYFQGYDATFRAAYHRHGPACRRENVR